MRWLAPYTWLALLGTATLSANCAIGARTAVCTDSQGTAELFADAACDVCASEACCAEATACANDPACLAAANCMKDCGASGDPACFAACRVDEALEPDLISDVVDCASTRCGDACVAPEVLSAPKCEDAGVIPDALGPTCGACIRRAACASAVECASDPICAARLTCMAERCQGQATTGRDGLQPGCFDACAAGEDTFYEGDRDFLSDVARECPSECRIGREFSCVGTYAWPDAETKTITVERRIQDRTANGRGFEQIRATACNPGPLSGCGTMRPFDISTAPEGLVQIEGIATDQGFGSADGFVGYYLLEAEPGSPDEEAWRPTIVFHTRPEWRTRRADEPDPYAPDSLLQPILQNVASSGGVDLMLDKGDDSDRGILVGGMVDCRGRNEFFAPGVSLQIDDGDELTVIRYVNEVEVGISPSATATTSAGQFIVVNVPTGVITARMIDEATGAVLSESSDINVEANTLTVVQFYPMPR